jgi:hypothetical protein
MSHYEPGFQWTELLSLSSRRGASKLQDEVCFLCLPPGFPAVPRYFVHTGLSYPLDNATLPGRDRKNSSVLKTLSNLLRCTEFNDG